MMHVPLDRPACYCEDNPPWPCMAWPDEETRKKINGDTCDGCAKLGEQKK